MSNALATSARQDLAESRRQLDQSQAIAHVGSWTWDAASNRVEFSDEQYRIYGLEPQSRYVGLGDYIALIHPDDRQEMIDAVRQASLDMEPFLVLHRIDH